MIKPLMRSAALFALLPLASAQTTTRVSLGDDGNEGNAWSWQESLSASGRLLAFHSYANNLVPIDQNWAGDVFIRDLVQETTTLVSVTPWGAPGNDSSAFPALSDNGRWLAFSSDASDLVPDDTNGAGDVFVRDLVLGVTRRVSVDSAGNEGLGDSGAIRGPAISADGRRVAFFSLAPNLVPGDTNATWDLFVHDIPSGRTRRVSVSSGGHQSVDVLVPQSPPALSSNGRYVAFEFSGDTLVRGDTNERPDVFVHDLRTRTTTRVNVGPGGTQAQLGAREPSISGNGRWVAFVSGSNDLVPGDTNSGADVFVHDRRTGRNVLASLSADGVQVDFGCRYPLLSRNGRYVAFESLASTLVPGDTNGKTDLFLRDVQRGGIVRLNVASDGSQAERSCYGLTMTADVRSFAYWTSDPHLVPGDNNSALDVFLTRLDANPLRGH